jgi:hypothetical protein
MPYPSPADEEKAGQGCVMVTSIVILLLCIPLIPILAFIFCL